MHSNSAKYNLKHPIRHIIWLSLFGMATQQVWAQTNDSTTQPDKGKEEQVEEVVVTGIRAALENALEVRRNADVFLDGVSADDIGSTPDLNLGEALQRIPGVQINREGERRDATISVRGLPGRFTKTTLQGQNIASPALGVVGNPTGGTTGNPFGIFDSSIFNGANVIKSFTADIPAGGLAANVDLQIKNALSRKEQFVARVEASFEETTDDYNPGLFLSGVKKFNDDFGIYSTVAYSEQSFRRDTIRVNGYSNFTGTRLTQLTASNPAFNISATDTNGVENQVIYPNEIRQFNLSNQGERMSSALGAEWQPTEELSLRLDGVYTKRSLDEARLDIFTISGGDTDGIVTPFSNPQFLGQFDRNNDSRQENVYLVSTVQHSDARPALGNRNSPSVDQIWAVYPQITWENESWKINAIATYSEAFGEIQENQFDFRINQTAGRLDANNDGIDDTGNGVSYIVNSGSGNWNNYALSTSIPSVLTNLQRQGTETWVLAPGNTFAAQINRNFVSPNGTSRNIGIPFFATGSDRRVDRDLAVFDFDVERNLELGPITGVGVGGFVSTENAKSTFQRNGGLGLQFNNITPDVLTLNVGASGAQGNFFGGNIPGTLRDQFYSLDLDLLRSQLFPALRTPPPGVTYTPTPAQNATNFPELLAASAATITYAETLRLIPDSRLGESFPRLPLRSDGTFNNNFESTRDSVEFYVQTKFDFSELNPAVNVRGNLGVRYINTDLSGQVSGDTLSFYDAINADRAARRANGETSTAANAPLQFKPGAGVRPAEATADFEKTLPSLNVIWDITSELAFRAAYYETFEALDLAEFSPAPTTVSRGVVDLDDTDTTTTQTLVSISSFDVKPRESQAYDLGLSWYHSEGSVISAGYFNKTLENDIFRSNDFCPIGQPYTVGDFTTPNPLELDVNGRCGFINELNQPERIRIRISRNNPNDIDLEGWEFEIQQHFDFLPGVLQHTGGVINHTRVDSSGGGGTKLFNVAEEVYNVIVYYDDDTFQMRLAYNWQSEIQREGGTSFSGSSTRSAPYDQLDFSVGINVVEDLELRFEAFNITNSTREEFVGVEELGQLTSYDGRTYGLSATYKW